MSLELVLFDYLNEMKRGNRTTLLNLGGASGPSGGTPGGVVGYTGRLPQTRVAYDESELATDETPVSGMSLLDNLNHIRYRIEVLESGIEDVTFSGFYNLTVSAVEPTMPSFGDLWVDIS